MERASGNRRVSVGVSGGVRALEAASGSWHVTVGVSGGWRAFSTMAE